MRHLKLSSIPCIHIPVCNIEASYKWWNEHFSLEVGEEMNNQNRNVSFRVENGQWIFLWEVEKPPENPQVKGSLMNSDNTELYKATLNFDDEKEKVIEEYNRLKRNGVHVGELHEAWTGVAFDLYDPDGNKFNVWGGKWEE
ncbi:VOC family protein [Rossellomorea aquimaris]|uniref:VOC family protein n=1 Tax=Rossellomorea aquimaris TaxID=189382 RepID=UPI0007D09AB1|nr:VOC family protein [Rossellomorea aquimaris]